MKVDIEMNETFGLHRLDIGSWFCNWRGLLARVFNEHQSLGL